MHQIPLRFGDAIDAAFVAVGLDFHGYSRAHPDRAERIGIWCLAVGQTIGYGCLYYIFAALLLSWDAGDPDRGCNFTAGG